MSRRLALRAARRRAGGTTPRRRSLLVQLRDGIGLFTAAAAVAGILYSALVFVLEYTVRTRIEVMKPMVVELRCSTLLFEREGCDVEEAPDPLAPPPEMQVASGEAAPKPPKHLSVTGAFRIRGEGSNVNTATLDEVTARVTLPGPTADDDVTVHLVAYWSGSIVPGNVSLSQVVPQSLADGESLQQEI